MFDYYGLRFSCVRAAQAPAPCSPARRAGGRFARGLPRFVAIPLRTGRLRFPLGGKPTCFVPRARVIGALISSDFPPSLSRSRTTPVFLSVSSARVWGAQASHPARPPGG